MAFVMKGCSYNTKHTPIYSVDMDDNVLGMAQNNGSILVNKNVSPLELEKNKTIEHEMVHLDQMERGDLDYTDTDVFWQGKKYPRSKMNEGAKNLPWEKEAYAKQDKQPPLKQVVDPTPERRKARLENYKTIKKINPKITDKQLDKAYRGIYRFEQLNPRPKY